MMSHTNTQLNINATARVCAKASVNENAKNKKNKSQIILRKNVARSTPQHIRPCMLLAWVCCCCCQYGISCWARVANVLCWLLICSASLSRTSVWVACLTTCLCCKLTVLVWRRKQTSRCRHKWLGGKNKLKKIREINFKSVGNRYAFSRVIYSTYICLHKVQHWAKFLNSKQKFFKFVKQWKCFGNIAKKSFC